MSDTGIYASRYAHVREFSDLLDNVLLGLLTEGEGNYQEDIQKLADELDRLADNADPDLADIQVRGLLRRSVDEGAWRRIACKLRDAKDSEDVKAELESLARDLDRDLSDMALKMRSAALR